MSNYVLGVILIVFSGLLFTQTAELDSDAALLPNIVLVGMGILGILMIVDPLIRKALNKPKIEEKDGGEVKPFTMNIFIFQILIPAGILIFTYFMLTWFGFYIASFFLILIIFFYHNYRMEHRFPPSGKMMKGLVFAVTSVAFMYVLFSILIGLPTPDGTIVQLG
ncbi:tripartite tricarboxylate transporter TctB family protein [Salsuginibacillus kocurii]|uniref:tripartite tricarboxylate transporter TctB family protein n=1 Tax=Salsuginibacillus kocurii TaxID=427078 RepID=UPI0003677C07|nr:tripartite tricarboxylate transporter TctB family protein [Salsuginibacillus kocurii]